MSEERGEGPRPGDQGDEGDAGTADAGGDGDSAQGVSRTGSRRRSGRDTISSLDEQIERLRARRAAAVARETERRRKSRTSYLVMLGGVVNTMADRGDVDAVALRKRIEQVVTGHNARTVKRWRELREESR